MMSWTIADIPDLSGMVAVVTGANGGLGLETTRALAAAGAHVVMAARNQSKANDAVNDILERQPDASLEIVELDLGALYSVRAASATIASAHPEVDILINNAGLMAMPQRQTADGFETQFGVNHLGHWTLTARLLPCLLAATAARIVTVTSTAHHFGRRVDPDNPNLDDTYAPWKAYGQSKLANYHFALGLQREFESRLLSPQSLVAHPGLSHTNLQVHTAEQGGGGRSAGLWPLLAKHVGMEASRGALPQLRAATDPRAHGGQMYAPRYINTGPPVQRPILRRYGLSESIKTLWAVSEDMTGETFDFGAAGAGRSS